MGLEELRDALRGTNEIQLTVTGRVSGRESSRPVWFVEEGDRLFLLPVDGSDSNWFKNLVKTPDVGLAADGEDFRTEAHALQDEGAVHGVVERFREKYGADQVTQYYPNQDAAVEVPLARG